ncbi:DUF1080 domain-containing protein [Phycisphaeraceae bacterium D3-23]
MPNDPTNPLTRRTLLSTATLSTLALAGAAIPSPRALAQDGHDHDHDHGDHDHGPAGPEGPHAFVDGTGHGWRALTEEDFTNVNCADDTWAWRDGILYCTGRPTGVLRSTQTYTNFEIVLEWNHRREGGNSGLFVWTPEDVIERMTADPKPGLPTGIEVQILDPGYNPAQQGTWFTSHGDVFPVGQRMTPFPPLSNNGQGPRSFPSEDRVKDHGHWNHYYVRAINGEIRLWVNGKEVSGGNECSTTSGYICLESEGAPIEFRNLRLRELA